jgi:1-phosphatidylinositol phosphodiesterase
MDDRFLAGPRRPGSPAQARRGPWRRLRRSALAVTAACGTVLTVVLAASAAVVPAASAAGPVADSQAYSRATTASEDNSKWMASVNGSTPIWQLSIPGTHDSYTAALSGFGPSFQAQTLPVPEQLKAGIRAIDVRLQPCSDYPPGSSACGTNPDDFTVEHGGVSTKTTLTDLLGQLQTFLSSNSSEFVILRIKMDDEGSNFAANFNSVLAPYASILWQGNAQATFEDPTLSQVRGKVVLLKQFDGTPVTINSYGMAYGATGFEIEDDWDLTVIGDMYSKWNQIVSNWTNAIAYAKTGGTSEGYITYLSGNGGAFPYTIASGSASQSGSPLFDTGVVVKKGDASKYPDFHQGSCTHAGKASLCSVFYTGMDLLMYDVLSNQNRAGTNHPALRGQQGMGLIYMDFPGQPLIDSIIANNPAA